MIYLSSVYHMVEPRLRNRIGYLINAMVNRGYEEEACQRPWLLDNGAFGGRWREAQWQKRLFDLRRYQDTCIGAVVPDVVSDLEGTLAQWNRYHEIVKEAGYGAFFVTQDLCTIEDVPWNELDGLFIGGSDEHKLERAWPLIAEALRRNVWVHVGRVNSARRLEKFAMCDSADGSGFVFNSKDLHRALELRNKQENIVWTQERIRAIKDQRPLFTLDS